MKTPANNPQEARSNAFEYIEELINSSGITLEQCTSREELKVAFRELLEKVILKEGADKYGIIGKEEIGLNDPYRKKLIDQLFSEYWSIIEPAIEDSNGTIQINTNSLIGRLSQVDPVESPKTGRPVVDEFLQNNLDGLRNGLASHSPQILSKPEDIKIFFSSALAMLGTTAFTVTFSQRAMRDWLNNAYLKFENAPILRQIAEDPIARDVLSWGAGALTAGTVIAVVSKMQRTLASETKTPLEKNTWVLLAFTMALTGMAFDAKGSLADVASEYHLDNQKNTISLSVEEALVGDSTPLAEYAKKVKTDTYRLEQQLNSYTQEEELRVGKEGKGPIWAGKKALTTGALPTPSLGADSSRFQTIKVAHNELDLALNTSENQIIKKTYGFVKLKGGEYGIDELYSEIQKNLNKEIDKKKAEIEGKIQGLEGADIIKTDQTRLEILQSIKELTQVTSEHEQAMLEVATIYSSYKGKVSQIAISAYGQELPLNPELEIESLDMEALEKALNIPIEKLEPKDFMGYIDVIKDLNPEGASQDFIEIFGRVLIIDFGAILFLAIATIARRNRKMKPLEEREDDLDKYKDALIKHFHSKVNDPILSNLIPNYKGFTERECEFFLDKTLEKLVSALDVKNDKAQKFEKVKVGLGALVGEDSTPEDREILYTHKALKLMLDKHGLLKAEIMQNLLLRLGLTSGNFEELAQRHLQVKATLQTEMEERDVTVARAKETEFRSRIERLGDKPLHEVERLKDFYLDQKSALESNPKNEQIVAAVLKELNNLLELIESFLKLFNECKTPDHLIKKYEIKDLKNLYKKILDAKKLTEQQMDLVNKIHIKSLEENFKNILSGLGQIDTWQTSYPELASRITLYKVSAKSQLFAHESFFEYGIEESKPKFQKLSDDFNTIKAQYTEAKDRWKVLEEKFKTLESNNTVAIALSVKYNRLPDDIKTKLGFSVGNYALYYEICKIFMNKNALPSTNEFNEVDSTFDDLITWEPILLAKADIIESKTLEQKGLTP